MKCMNRVTLIGRVGKDPEVRVVGQTKVAQFSLATSEGGYTKQDGTEVKEQTQWHNIVVWRNMADVVEKYVKKGQQVTIEGKIQYRSWQKQDGTTAYATDIIAEDLFLAPQSLGQQGQQNQPQKQLPPTNQAPQAQYVPQPQYQAPQGYQQVPPQQGYQPTQWGGQQQQGGFQFPNDGGDIPF